MIQKNTPSLQKYPAYKDSGVEWLGEVPEHWKILNFRYLISILTDFTANGSFGDLAKNVEYLDFKNYSRLIRLTDLRKNLENQGVFLSEKSHKFLYKSELFGGELLMANVGAYAGLAWIMPFVRDKASLGPNMFLIKLYGDNSIKFFELLINSSLYKDHIHQIAKSAAQPKLNKDNIRQLRIILPPLPEQTAIAAFLDDKTSKIDQAISIKERQITLLKERKQIMIQDLVTGKKVWNKEENAWTEPVEVKDSGVEWIGKIPVGWEVRNLRYAFEFLNHKRVPLSAVEREKMQGEFPYYGASGIIDYVNKFIFAEKLILIGEDGANLLSKSTPLAFVADGKYWVNNHAHILRPLYPGFSYWAEQLSLIDYTVYISGAAQPKLSRGNLGSVKIIVPSPKDLYAISDYIDNTSQKIDTAISLKQQEIEKLKEYKSSLIDSVVTGKVKIIDN